MISSLEALRKLTRPDSQPKDPVEGFQKYLETKKSPVPKLTSVQIFRRGAGLGKLQQISQESDSKLLEKYLKVWRFETVRPVLESEKDFIESQISFILFRALSKLELSHTRTYSKYFSLWKSSFSYSSSIPLIFQLDILFTKTKKFALNKLFFKQFEKTKLVYFVINHLTGVVRKKFLTWKKKADKIWTEHLVLQKNAVLNFREFQNSKVLELVYSYRKVRQLMLKKFFFRWTRVEQKPVKFEEEVKKKDKEKISIKKLKRQKDKHLHAVTETNIKIELVNMMIRTLNTIYK